MATSPPAPSPRRVLLGFALLLLFAAIAAAAPTPTPTPLFCSSSSRPQNASSSDQVVSLYLAATNDVHNRVDELDPYDGSACTPAKRKRGVCAGGFARLATFFRQARERAANECAAAIVADAGDQTTGQAWDAVYKQSETAGLMRRAGYDVTTLGNHEFDFDLSTLARFVSELGAAAANATTGPPIPMLGGCSIASYGSSDPASAATLNKTIERFLVKEVVVPGLRSQSDKNGRAAVLRPPALLKIGFIGYVVSSTARTQTAAKNVTFVPDDQAAVKCAQELRGKHPDLDAVVALSHLGYTADVALAPKLVGLVDLVIGGHSHTFLASSAGGGGPIWDLNATSAAKAEGGKGGGDGTTAKKVDGATCAAAGACDGAEGPYPTVVESGGSGGRSLTIVQARFASIYANLLRLDFALAPNDKAPSSSPLGRRGGAGAASNTTTTATAIARPSRLLSIASATGGAPALLGGPFSSNPVAQDEGMLRYIAGQRGAVDALAKAQVGRALAPDGLALGDARHAESPLATYLCGAMLAEAANDTPGSSSSPDVCLIGAGALRQGIQPGPVTRADVAAAHPYGNALALARVTAAQLVEAAEHGLTGVSVQAGRFPQVGGLRLYLDYSKGVGGNPAFVALYLLPPLPGQGAGNGYRAALAAEKDAKSVSPPLSAADRARLGVRLRAGDNTTTLVLASSDYILGGGDGYGMLARGQKQGLKTGGGAPPLIADLLADAIARDTTSSASGGARAPSAQDALNPRIVDCAAAREKGRCGAGGGDVVYRPCCSGDRG